MVLDRRRISQAGALHSDSYQDCRTTGTGGRTNLLSAVFRKLVAINTEHVRFPTHNKIPSRLPGVTARLKRKSPFIRLTFNLIGPDSQRPSLISIRGRKP